MMMAGPEITLSMEFSEGCSDSSVKESIMGCTDCWPGCNMTSPIFLNSEVVS